VTDENPDAPAAPTPQPDSVLDEGTPFPMPPLDVQEKSLDPPRRMPRDGDRTKEPGEHLDPSDSPFPVPPIEGIPFARDSEEAEAIRRVLEKAAESSALPRRD
jgi:hypothetical protein